MKRGLFFLIAILLTACQRDLPTTPLSHRLIVQDLSAEDHLIQTLDHQHFFDRISANVDGARHQSRLTPLEIF
jgi:hypothetical protein